MASTSGGHSSSLSSNSKLMCRWTDCTCLEPFETVQELVDHVNCVHVEPFNSQELVLCLWEGCRVYNVPCQKKAWLIQHMRRHTNERPHKCIMNGCNQSFWNIDALNQHLQLHLMPSPQTSKKVKKKNNDIATNSSSITHDDISIKKSSSSNGCHSSSSSVRCTSVETAEGIRESSNSCSLPLVPPQPIAVNGGLIHNDAIDSRVMTVIKKSVITQYSSSSNCDEGEPASTCTLTGKIIGRRKTLQRVEPDLLIQWHPRIIPDSWIPSTDYTGYKILPFSELLHCQKALLVQSQYLTGLQSCCDVVDSAFVKRKRKRESLD